MSYNLIYTKEYNRILRAVLVDVRYEGTYPTVTNDDLFYSIEADNGSLAGVLILTVNNSLKSCVIKFQEIRVPFKGDAANIQTTISTFIFSNNWQQNFIFT